MRASACVFDMHGLGSLNNGFGTKCDRPLANILPVAAEEIREISSKELSCLVVRYHATRSVRTSSLSLVRRAYRAIKPWTHGVATAKWSTSS